MSVIRGGSTEVEGGEAAATDLARCPVPRRGASRSSFLSSPGSIAQDEGDLHIHLIFGDLAVLDRDAHLLDPAPLTLHRVLVARSMPWRDLPPACGHDR